MSPITSTPASRASSTDQCGTGWVSGAPGVSTSAAKLTHDTFRKSAVMKPACAALARLSMLSSPAITSAPPAFSAWQLASPEPPSPNTATVLPAKEVTRIKEGLSTGRPGERRDPYTRDSDVNKTADAASHTRGGGYGARRSPGRRRVNSPPTSSPQLQRRQPGQRQHHRDNPEPDHDLRLGPSLLLEMVVQRRHPEHAFAGQLERDHLHDDGYRLQHEQPADDGEHQLVLGRHRDRAEHAAERQRAGIAHEDRRRRRVEPEEAEAGAEHRAAQHRQLAGA